MTHNLLSNASFNIRAAVVGKYLHKVLVAVVHKSASAALADISAVCHKLDLLTINCIKIAIVGDLQSINCYLIGSRTGTTVRI